jgi:hypothetical protein
MASPIPRTSPELLLKLTHLRGSISELMLRSGARLNQLRHGAVEPAIADELLRYHQDLGAQISELEMVLDSLRRRGEEAEQVAADELGAGKLHIECDRLDALDLEALGTTLRRCYEELLFARAPALPLEKVQRLDELHLLVHVSRLEGALVLHLKAPVLEGFFVPTLIDVARTVGIGEKPSGGARGPLPLGWGPSLLQVRRMAERSLWRSGASEERLRESLDSMDAQLDDQLASLVDPAALGLPPSCLRAVAELLSGLVLTLKEHGHVRVLRLSYPNDELFLLDEVGREPRVLDERPARDVLREKVDRFVKIQRPDT